MAYKPTPLELAALNREAQSEQARTALAETDKALTVAKATLANGRTQLHALIERRTGLAEQGSTQVEARSLQRGARYDQHLRSQEQALRLQLAAQRQALGALRAQLAERQAQLAQRHGEQQVLERALGRRSAQERKRRIEREEEETLENRASQTSHRPRR